MLLAGSFARAAVVEVTGLLSGRLAGSRSYHCAALAHISRTTAASRTWPQLQRRTVSQLQQELTTAAAGRQL